MIGRLSGLFVDAEGDDAVIDVAGVGYLVRCGARTLSRLPPLGEPVVLQIESQTREDGTRLFGFLSKSDRAAFVALQAIQGVGPKAALAVLDILPPAELAAAVVRDDRAAVARASGVGPKLAQRIVTELKGKPLVAGLSIGPDVSGPAPSASPVVRVSGEAVAALLGLGIAESAARRAVETAEQRLGPDPALSALIKAALQEVGR
jgi:Holliday junction DNA helicase RuvA